MDREKLKNILFEIKNNDYEVLENIVPYDLTLNMLEFIGDVDSVLRDDLILTIIYKWIFKDTLAIDEIYKILKICLDENHLFYKIGQVNDSVFTRTFSVLVIGFVLCKHRTNKFLKEKDISIINERVIQFANKDIDIRGYVEEKGWAHGTAHLADTFNELAYCEEIGYQELMLILETIRRKVQVNYYTYIHGEDERLVTAVVGILNREIIDKMEFIKWIKSFSIMEKTNEYPMDMIIELNVKNFLRSLFFRIYEKQEYKEFIVSISEVLKNMSRFT